MIYSEIWNKVISWNTIFLSEISFHLVFQSFFFQFDIILGVNNILIFSKIWYRVVSWNKWIFCLREISMKGFLQFLFSIRNGVCNIDNISINTKIWNQIPGQVRLRAAPGPRPEDRHHGRPSPATQLPESDEPDSRPPRVHLPEDLPA